ncbi:2,5-diamino-6-ribosylamino-4(3H)-pyrimidinone 5'-phosphate reductase [Rhizophlyctis rosea]|uniref:2,5-diamino-6-ribosylamino-4(3H)-pyrimidinone 5'-phosphate reductase n=1 Tax=Rhizophlyctis rosea TaxID=64517 RepID=A0AAD5SFE9_9FUNG|nr:2,5-diamino-6-ribosylamino-4(3H)-pyrimidinone 5'-phosphate reductase [Rhizophlyctis rosea]
MTARQSPVVTINPRVAEFTTSPTTEEVFAFYALPTGPLPPDRPYCWSNTISTLDGVTHFLETEKSVRQIGLQHIPRLSKHSKIDVRLLNGSWATADAVLITGQILRDEDDVLCCVNFEDLKKHRLEVLHKPTPQPLQIILTNSCNFDFTLRIFGQPGLDVLILTTREGHDIAQNKIANLSTPVTSNLQVLACESGPDGGVDFTKALKLLKSQFNITYLDISTGGTTIHNLIDLGLLDECRMTVANQLAGHVNTSSQVRPHAHPYDVKGLRFYAPETAPLVAWKGVRMAGEHFMFYRGVYEYRHLGN